MRELIYSTLFVLLWAGASSLQAESPIIGFRNYKLGGKVPSKSTATSQHPFYYVDKSKKNRVTIYGNQEAKIRIGS